MNTYIIRAELTLCIEAESGEKAAKRLNGQILKLDPIAYQGKLRLTLPTERELQEFYDSLPEGQHFNSNIKEDTECTPTKSTRRVRRSSRKQPSARASKTKS